MNFANAVAYVSDVDRLIYVEDGSGDNLIREDIEEGYVDYVNFTTYFLDDEICEDDGGMYMYRKNELDKPITDIIKDIIETTYGIAPKDINIIRRCD